MGALAVHLKATYRQQKWAIGFVLLIILLGRSAEFLVAFLTGSSGLSRLSETNMLILLIPMLALTLPVSYYRRIVHLGASRGQYFKGLHAVFVFWAGAVALSNSLWIAVQTHVFHNYAYAVDMVDAFQWNDFGFAGSFLYQTVFYLMVMALLSMLMSGHSHPAGWALTALLIAAIPVGTAVPSLRVHVASFFRTLLFNDSLWLGAGLNLMLYLLFVAGGWYFTKRRTY